jgi:hypothetical protein
MSYLEAKSFCEGKNQTMPHMYTLTDRDLFANACAAENLDTALVGAKVNDRVLSIYMYKNNGCKFPPNKQPETSNCIAVAPTTTLIPADCTQVRPFFCED